VIYDGAALVGVLPFIPSAGESNELTFAHGINVISMAAL